MLKRFLLGKFDIRGTEFLRPANSEGNLEEISPAFYEKLFLWQIPKAQKILTT